jgi:Tfp pilus assembly protein PilN
MPADGRSSRGTAGGAGGAVYVLLGALAALVVLASLWAVASRQTGDRRVQLDRANAEATAAEARASAAEPFEAFARLAKDRVDTVSALAATRFDWSGAMHEISRVLPADVWLTELAGASGASGADAQSPSPTTRVAPAPTFKLDGCTRSQAKVALLMARLRSVHGVREVDLSKSQKPESKGGETCPANRESDPRFTITIAFEAPGAGKPQLDASGQVVSAADAAAAAAAAAPPATAPTADGAPASAPQSAATPGTNVQ